MNFSRLAAIAIVISLCLHFLVGTGLWFAPSKKPNARHRTIVELINSPEDLKKRAKSEHDRLAGQIVQQNSRPLNDEKPKDSKFVSQHNQKVERETRAAQTGRFSNSGGRNGIQGKSDKPKLTKEPEKKVDQAQLEKSTGGDILHKFAPQMKREVQDDAAPGTGENSQIATNDHLKEVAIGVQTLLSTRQFIYYSYYNRIKEKLQQYWEPKIKTKVAKIMNQGRSIASSADKVTKTIITLDRKGVLVKVQIIGASGLSDLDDAAVEAFREAAPFPNPPAGIVDADGYIRIRWDFILEAQNGYAPYMRKSKEIDGPDAEGLGA